ncbi:MAG: hypothetical protein F4013_07035 [Gammaproteobacteria bacterium]|nr:hypothetical protein [Gammaproteobacteria bacterium]MYL01443.1 hypothetical protein [Gammaproteobacteria bacterium]
MDAAGERLSRRIKGGRKYFFQDPATDALLASLLKLMAEHWVVRERLMSLETLILGKGLLTREEIEEFEPDAEQAGAWATANAEMIRKVLAPFEELGEERKQ